MIGSTLAHYRILERLGSGGMGEVYRAEDARLQRQVAIKVLPPTMASDPERLERFAREAKAVGGLNHPNIVTIHAIEEVAGQRILVMELVEGRPLDELIPSGGMDRERFFELAIQLADAVSAAHEHGVTHRDIKPSNVMVAAGDRVKVVDFGLAKLRQAARSAERTVALPDDLTEEGRILGTYPYMSPEQIKGQAADHRSDIFSLGVVLYEMATGQRPFAGETSADLISSILRDVPAPPAEANRQLPRHLDRIVAHCLEKDPDRRFQTAKDLRNELQSLRQELESDRLLRTASWPRWLPAPGHRRRPVRLAAAAAALVALLAAGGLLWRARDLPTGGTPSEALRAVATARRPSVAVLFFQNLSGDADLDWLRTGLADMLVTDLSQAPNLRVLPTDRVYQILKDLGHLDEPRLTTEVVREVAERAEVATVLLGSFARAGDTLQVNIQLQDAETGEILSARRVQGTGEASVFSTVDRLSRDLRRSFELPQRDPEIERKIESVTTSSVEAYRAYVEGMRLRRELKIEEAIPLFERAAALDPSFAMAHARLASVHDTLGQEQAQREALEAAYTHADRLPARERFFIEGSYLALRREGYERAIEAYERALDLYPDHDAARYQLAHVYSFLELHDRAIAHYEELLRRGYDYDGVYNALATMYAAEGRFQTGHELLTAWAGRQPESWSAALIRALFLEKWGRLDEAATALERADELRPGSPFVAGNLWRQRVLRGDWQAAAAPARELAASESPFWRWYGSMELAYLALYHGRADEGLGHMLEALEAFPGPEPQRGAGRCRTASLLLALDRPAEALAQAEAAREDAPGDWPAAEALYWSALAHQRLGGEAEADRLAAELAARAGRIPGSVEERWHHHLLGVLALARGDTEAALRELERTEEMLPPEGVLWHRHRLPDHVQVWHDLASAQHAAGNAEAAERWYRRVIESGTERLEFPVEHVRSHYLLGRLLEERGDREGARHLYRAFLGFWGGGDLDGERVEDARTRLARLGG